ncbi:protein-L-isoaspartate O-methyltransferase [Methylocystaceae bacterium]|nr:protein-L-isoaspartate O-methyltransferase [Methylocystaceae bacterium]
MSDIAVAPISREKGQSLTTSALRTRMVDRQIRPFDVTDVPVLDQFLYVPREYFLPENQISLAYSDLAIKLVNSANPRRTLLPPLILARMIQGSTPREGDRVLTLGGGGYSAAILAGLVSEVVVVESDQLIAQRMLTGFKNLGINNIHVEISALSRGAPHLGPFDIILVEGAVDTDLSGLSAQLSKSGRIMTIATPELGAGRQLSRFDNVKGHLEGALPILSVHVPVLEGFEKTSDFVF